MLSERTVPIFIYLCCTSLILNLLIFIVFKIAVADLSIVNFAFLVIVSCLKSNLSADPSEL